MTNDDTPAGGIRLDRHVPPEWLGELQASVLTYRGSVHYGQVCIEREES